MGLRSSQEYINSLRDGREVYYRGKRVDDVTKHDILKSTVNHASLIYKWQQDEKTRELTVYKDDVYGYSSKFYKIPRNGNDLIERFNLIYETSKLGRGSFDVIKAIGSDALFALMIVAKKTDSYFKTHYYENVMKFYEYVIKNDLGLAVAQTDVKGDRDLRPFEQEDKDLYLRIVDKNKDGIIVRGAKAQITQAPVANEIIVLPTRNMGEKDKDYAVSFSIPPNTKGLKMISKPLKASETALNDPWFVLGKENMETQSLVIFDDVFVPWDRVFLAGEYQLAGPLAVMFPTFHRFTAISYRAVIADLLIGLGKLLAELNGIDDKSHVRRDIVDMIKYKEILRESALAASLYAELDEDTKIAIPNRIFTNVGKLVSNESYLNVVKDLVEIAGGLADTLPATQDFYNEEEVKYLKKYLVGKKGTDPLTRAKLLSLTREILSSLGAFFTTIMIHAEGSIEASVIELYRSYNYEESKKLAYYASGISDEMP
ncbi:4-hydroxyphenylacetate 3-hydroxylase N-terminal domain-containing protein [Caldisphaera sp.]|uniref:4-hydroxyphenylacetate 3-hydroxylase N-terminal domain-containing protein n=1 Tax=Caldisphaera sp. TaxID=2060322 RepID=UPI003D0DA4F3